MLRELAAGLRRSLGTVSPLARALRPAPPGAAVHGCVDAPRPGTALDAVAQVCGWVLAAEGEPVERIDLYLGQTKLDAEVERIARDDVHRVYPAQAAFNPLPGYQAAIITTGLPPGHQVLRVVGRSRGAEVVIAEVPVEIRPPTGATFFTRALVRASQAHRDRQLQVLLPLLRCVACGSRLERTPAGLRCSPCQAGYEVRNGVPIMISGAAQHPVDPAALGSPASNNVLPPPLVEMMEETLASGGVILDVGSGRRLFGVDRYIQLEICAYPFTDVVSQDVRLPFRDEAFDLVMCVSVTEHVKAPWILAREITRVCRRGGRVYVDSAFMQPFHGYPHHYFNMTRLGLREIFGELDVETLEPAQWQHPWYALSWFLGELLPDLEPGERDRIQSMTVEEFAQDLKRCVNGEPSWLRGVRLSATAIEKLAAGFTLVGRRR